MTEEKNKIEVKPYPWDIVGRFNSFEEADNFRSSISERNNTVQVKVRKLSKDFVVKTRVLPEFRAKPNNKKNRKKGKKRKSNDS